MIKILELEDLDKHARIQCCLCEEKKDLFDIKSKMEKGDKWTQVIFTGKYICPDCFKKL